jgi:lipopolysaccharide export LptBFGC system permease protein LptF
MIRRPAGFVSSLVCELIALLHVVRLVFGAELTVAGVEIPRWASIPPVLFFGVLGAWLWAERRASLA